MEISRLHLEGEPLRAHFDTVDRELRGRAATHLNPEQRTIRDRLIGWLREYRNAGQFPRNTRFPGKQVPLFRDERGTLCAMAYLIARSGRPDIVDQVARSRNNAFIAELADDPGLLRWLESVGLTVTEAARIQPTYGGEPEELVSAGYALTSLLVSGSGLTTLGLNLFAPSRAGGFVGVTAGGAGIVVGATHLDEPRTEKLTVPNLLIGAAALTAGIVQLARKSKAEPREGLSRIDRRQRKSLVVTPALMATSRTPQLGLQVRATF